MAEVFEGVANVGTPTRLEELAVGRCRRSMLSDLIGIAMHEADDAKMADAKAGKAA